MFGAPQGRPYAVEGTQRDGTQQLLGVWSHPTQQQRQHAGREGLLLGLGVQTPQAAGGDRTAAGAQAVPAVRV
eukprot:scaffold60733_cov32-Tisochrysis_lutea.AAC.2